MKVSAILLPFVAAGTALAGPALADTALAGPALADTALAGPACPSKPSPAFCTILDSFILQAVLSLRAKFSPGDQGPQLEAALAIAVSVFRVQLGCASVTLPPPPPETRDCVEIDKKLDEAAAELKEAIRCALLDPTGLGLYLAALGKAAKAFSAYLGCKQAKAVN